MDHVDILITMLSKLSFDMLLEMRLVNRFWNTSIINNLSFFVKAKLSDNSKILSQFTDEDYMYIIKHGDDNLDEYNLAELVDFYEWFSPMLNELFNKYLSHMKRPPRFIEKFFKTFIENGFLSKVKTGEWNIESSFISLPHFQSVNLDPLFENDVWIGTDISLFRDIVIESIDFNIIEHDRTTRMKFTDFKGITSFDDMYTIMNVTNILISRYFDVIGIDFCIDNTTIDQVIKHIICTGEFKDIFDTYEEKMKNMTSLKKIQLLIKSLNYIYTGTGYIYTGTGNIYTEIDKELFVYMSHEINKWIMTLE